MSVKPLSCPTKRLSLGLLSTDTGAKLYVNNILGWNGVALTSANFGTLHYVVLRSSDNTKMEIIEIDATTIANAAITITKRGLDFNGGTSTVTANQLAWPANDTLVDFGSDPAQLFAQYANLTQTQTVTAKWTFATGATPAVTDAPVSGTDAVNKTYADGIAIAGGANASSSTKGISKLSVDPASPTNPIAVGQNDPILSTTTASSATNKLMTQTDNQNAQETYIASTGSANAYLVSYTPAVTAYVAGQRFTFKANFGNTGSATVAVNGQPAKTIKKLDGATNLASGDIANGQIVHLSYDGTNFQMLSPTAPAPVLTVGFKNGSMTKNTADASTTQNIAHGLGVIPKYIRMSWAGTPGSTNPGGGFLTVVYNGTTTSVVGVTNQGNINYVVANGLNLTALAGDGSTNYQTGVVTFDATNIIITWTKTGTPTGVYSGIWEAFA